MVLVMAFDVTDNDGNFIAFFKRQALFKIGKFRFRDQSFHLETDIDKHTVGIFAQHAGLHDGARVHTFSGIPPSRSLIDISSISSLSSTMAEV